MSYFTKRPGSIEEAAAKLTEKDSEYQAMFRKELDKEGKGIASMSPAEKTAFFNKIDKMYKAKNEDATDAEINVFHKKLDKLVHKSFGKSSDEKNMQEQETLKIRIIPKKGDKESEDAWNYLKKYNANLANVGSYGLHGNVIQISVPTTKAAQAKVAMANKKFGQYTVKVVGNPEFNKYESFEGGHVVKEESNPFELYQSIAGWQQASAEMKKEMEKAKKMSDKKKARQLMYAVQKKFAKYGAQDTEANSEIRYQLGLAQGEEVNEAKVECPKCEGKGCDHCDNKGYHMTEDKGFTDQQIKMAYGVANDKRYKDGNYTGAVNAIEKIAKGLSKHPDVMKVLKRVNEESLDKLKEDVAKMLETHTYMTKAMNDRQKTTGGEKEIVKPIKKEEDQIKAKPNMNETTAKNFGVYKAIADVWSNSAEELEKIQDEAQWLKTEGWKKKNEEEDQTESEKEKTGKTAIGTKKTKVETEPEVEYQK